MKLEFGPRRGIFIDIEKLVKEENFQLSQETIKIYERIDLIYRTLCGILYNFVPQSGHPGGSISSGRIVEGLFYNTMLYNISSPDDLTSDILCYAAGHKAMGLYASLALRNEGVKIFKKELLPSEDKQLRLEDLLGFRRNPTTSTPLFKKYNAKPLDGHPTPAVPFVKITTGASGFGVPISFGLALGAVDTFGTENPPYVHVLEGEGGMTAGRVQEAFASASASLLKNVIIHIDWNQASIDSNRVCRDFDKVGDYVQWDPIEFSYLHDFNVLFVKDGTNFNQILKAQNIATSNINSQPTAIVYRTIKGFRYGIEGKASHGAGHKFCSEEYYNFLNEFETEFNINFPRFKGEKTPSNIEENFFDSLMIIRKVLENNKDCHDFIGNAVLHSKENLKNKQRKIREDKPNLSIIYEDNSEITPYNIPKELALTPGQSVTLRGVLGDVLNYLNVKTNGAFFCGSADLLESTSASKIAKGFPSGYYNTVSNPQSRLISVGGICEDALGGIMAGISTFGTHIGVSSSYAGFIASLQHITARLHGIAQQAKYMATNEPYKTFIIICAHAGLKTGEDGPTHADPQALQLFQGNFPKGVMITLTPFSPDEIWPLIVAGLKARPAILAPFVTRPNEIVIDREKLKLCNFQETVKGIYPLRKADFTSKEYHGTLVLQESGVTYTFLNEVLPRLDEKGLNLNIYYVSSADLFDLLSEEEKEEIYPEKLAKEAIGITGFTFPTISRWILSYEGRKRTLHAFKKGHYLGSGTAEKVLEEAGLDGESQFKAVLEYAISIEKSLKI